MNLNYCYYLKLVQITLYFFSMTYLEEFTMLSHKHSFTSVYNSDFNCLWKTDIRVLQKGKFLHTYWLITLQNTLIIHTQAFHRLIIHLLGLSGWFILVRVTVDLGLIQGTLVHSSNSPLIWWKLMDPGDVVKNIGHHATHRVIIQTK